MADITIARALAETDALAATMLRLKGSSTYGAGDNSVEEPQADVGARGRIGTQQQTVLGYAENDYIPLIDGQQKSIDKIGFENLVASTLGDWYNGLESVLVAAGLANVNSLTAFFAYYNSGDGGPWAGLVAPDFGRGVYFYINGAFMSALNVYSPAIADMAHRVRTTGTDAALVAGTDVDGTKYAGAALAKLLTASFAGAADTVVVTGNGRSSTGAAITGHVWTAHPSADGTLTLTPAVTGDILLSVTNIVPGAAITGGTFTVQAAIPAGRTNPPT